jgi:hypothetical protein
MSGQPTTDRIAEIQDLTIQWVSELLDEPDVQPEDNFIDLGGHSILGVRLSRRAKEHFGHDYDLMILFEKDLSTAAAELASRVLGPEQEQR